MCHMPAALCITEQTKTPHTHTYTHTATRQRAEIAAREGGSCDLLGAAPCNSSHKPRHVRSTATQFPKVFLQVNSVWKEWKGPGALRPTSHAASMVWMRVGGDWAFGNEMLASDTCSHRGVFTVQDGGVHRCLQQQHQLSLACCYCISVVIHSFQN